MTLIASCSSDWLDTTPTSSTTPDNLFNTVENAEMTINGIARLMMKQHTYYRQGWNGEGSIMFYHGEMPGNDWTCPHWTGYSGCMNQIYHESNTRNYDTYPWYYYYRIIGNANTVLENVDACEGSESRKAFLKAQALTFRAHAYTMLIQIYGHRWSDSNNGADSGVVLRIDTSTDGLPLSTIAECYAQIYQDLDDAIDIYTTTAKGEVRSSYSHPNVNVAYAIYARAALTREDWSTAATMAVKAYDGYPLMSVDDYYDSDFCEPTSEWLWAGYQASDQNLQYYPFFGYMGYNASTSAARTYRKCISKELLEQFPDTDIRKHLFVHPGLLPAAYQDFTDEDLVNQTNGQVTDKKMLAAIEEAFPDKQKDASASVYVYEHRKFGVFGAPALGNLCFYRSSEMYLIEAEANYRLNNISAAQKAMNALNRDSKRDPEYSCTKTGEALFEEIVKYRRLELWGEGFNWFDYKRWSLPIVRKSFANGGNFHELMAVTIQPDEVNQWTWVIPETETLYNDQIQ